MNKKKLITIIVIAVIVIAIALIIVLCSGSKEVKLNIDCNGKDISNTFKEEDTFECEILGQKNKLIIKDISSKKVKIQAEDYGLTPVKDNNTINLIEQVKDFEVVKGKELKLALQATDATGFITIKYE